MPHPDNPLLDRGYRYPPDTWQADWFQERFDRLTALIEERRAARPRPSTDGIAGYIGGDARYYLTEDESNDLAEAAGQVEYAERCRARERVAEKRRQHLAQQEVN